MPAERVAYAGRLAAASPRSLRRVGIPLVVRLALALLVVQILFTVVVRGIVVPRLTPAVHWRYGLQLWSDSQVFQAEAESLAARMRQQGWVALGTEQFEGLSHTKLLASLYYLTGSDNPWSIYALDGLLFACSGVLMFLLFRETGVDERRSALGAAVISCGPLYLFSHSELLREPFVVPAALIFVLGVTRLLRPSQRSIVFALGAGAIASIGFLLASTFRPYLMLLLFASFVLAVGLGTVVSLVMPHSLTLDRARLAVAWGTIVVLLLAYVVPNQRRVHRYSDESVTAGSSLADGVVIVTGADGRKVAVDPEMWRRTVAAKDGKSEFTRADFLVPHWCTIQWRAAGWLPGTVNRKLESIACARQDYLRFCDTSLLGRRADRYCDEVNFQSPGGVLKHLPGAAVFSLLVPYPRMWFDGFGSGGTGLRRAGYIVDGVVGYLFLAGLIPLALYSGRRRPELVILAIALIAMLTVYGLAVPTQFILARLRLALFTPLLVLGAAGWFRWQQQRSGGPAA